MKLLRNFDEFIKYYDIDADKHLTFKSFQKTIGTYKIMEGIVVGVFVNDEDLYFLYGNKKIRVPDSYRLIVRNMTNKKVELVLTDGSNEILKITYNAPEPFHYDKPFDYLNDDKWENYMTDIINDKVKKSDFIEILR